jgi:hypothetical protein
MLFREAWFSPDKVQISGHPHARRRDSWRKARVGHCCPAIGPPGLVSAARPQEEHHCHEQVDQVGRERSPGQSMGSSEHSSFFFLMKVFIPKIIWLLIDRKEKIEECLPELAAMPGVEQFCLIVSPVSADDSIDQSRARRLSAGQQHKTEILDDF